MVAKKKPPARKAPVKKLARKKPVAAKPLRRKTRGPVKPKVSKPRGEESAVTQYVEHLYEKAKRIKADDIEKIIHRAADIRAKVKAGSALGYYWETIKHMLSFIRDYWKGRYRKMPWHSVAAVAAALAYVLSPIDLVPDVIPLLGMVDDAAVIAACLALFERDLEAHAAWAANNAA